MNQQRNAPARNSTKQVKSENYNNNNKRNSRKSVSGNNKKKKPEKNGGNGASAATDGKKENQPPAPTRELNKLPEPPVKLERAKTFVLGHTLNKMFHKITGSRESLNKIEEHEDENRFTLKRSLTLSSISLKRHNRKSLQKPVLEELKEDAVLEKVEPVVKQPSPPPFEPAPLKRSGSFIDRLKRRLSTTRPTKDAGMRSSWGASLQNLQQIDNMVNYDDMKFVNYDMFNTYAQRIERQLSQTDLTRNYSTLDLRDEAPLRRYPSSLSLRSIDPMATVRLRPKKRISFNLDQDKNLFRQSLDSVQFHSLKNVQHDPPAADEQSPDRRHSFNPKLSENRKRSTTRAPGSPKLVMSGSPTLTSRASHGSPILTSRATDLPESASRATCSPKLTSRVRGSPTLTPRAPGWPQPTPRAPGSPKFRNEQEYYIFLKNSLEDEEEHVLDALDPTLGVAETINTSEVETKSVQKSEGSDTTDNKCESEAAATDCIGRNTKERLLSRSRSMAGLTALEQELLDAKVGEVIHFIVSAVVIVCLLLCLSFSSVHILCYSATGYARLTS